MCVECLRDDLSVLIVFLCDHGQIADRIAVVFSQIAQCVCKVLRNIDCGRGGAGDRGSGGKGRHDFKATTSQSEQMLSNTHRLSGERSVLVYDTVSLLTRRCGVRIRESDHAEESDGGAQMQST